MRNWHEGGNMHVFKVSKLELSIDHCMFTICTHFDCNFLYPSHMIFTLLMWYNRAFGMLLLKNWSQFL